MTDRVGVLDYPVAVAPVSGILRQKLLTRLDVMDRELRHQQMAIAAIRTLAMAMPQQKQGPLAVAVSTAVCYLRVSTIDQTTAN